MSGIQFQNGNPWGERAPVYADEVARNVARDRAMTVLSQANIVVRPDLIALAPDQVLYKLSTATVGQVEGILVNEALAMIDQNGLDRKDWREAASLREAPLQIFQ